MSTERTAPATLRVIGGKFRGSTLLYDGDVRTRPMKDRVREAVFNLLGKAVAESLVLDLFAGTGAMSIEAISRGARQAVLLERNFAAARMIQRNLDSLQLTDVSELLTGDTFFHAPRWLDQTDLPRIPWTVFCCPPYDLFVQEPTQLMDLLRTILQKAPSRSLLVVESDLRFDPHCLPDAAHWEHRPYPPAVIHLLERAAKPND